MLWDSVYATKCWLFFFFLLFILAGTIATYLRFIPYIRKNYDYGVVIFLLTFNLITVSSYRVHNVLSIAHQRLYAIAIGCGLCLIMSLLVFPNWSGEELHNSTVSKLEGLARSIEGIPFHLRPRNCSENSNKFLIKRLPSKDQWSVKGRDLQGTIKILFLFFIFTFQSWGFWKLSFDGTMPFPSLLVAWFAL